jgi:hypothetical protein
MTFFCALRSPEQQEAALQGKSILYLLQGKTLEPTQGHTARDLNSGLRVSSPGSS